MRKILETQNIKHDIGDSQKTTKCLCVNAGIKNSKNNYTFRPFLVVIIRLYIRSFKIIYSIPISCRIVHSLEGMNIQPDAGH